MVIDDIIHKTNTIESYPSICFNCRHLVRHSTAICGKFSIGSSFVHRCDYHNALGTSIAYTNHEYTTIY